MNNQADAEMIASILDTQIESLEDQLKQLQIKRLQLFAHQEATMVVEKDRLVFNEAAIIQQFLNGSTTPYRTIEELQDLTCRFFYQNKAITVAFNATLEITSKGHLLVSAGEGADSIDLRSAGIRVTSIVAPSALLVEHGVKAFVYVEDLLSDKVV